MSATRKETSTNSENRGALGRACLLNDSLARIGARWKMQTLYEMARGAESFGALKQALPRVSDQMLSTRLRELVNEGLATRMAEPLGEAPARTTYRPTPRGFALLAIMERLCEWESSGPRT